MISLRVCAVCHKKAPKEEFLRVVRVGDEYVVDLTYKVNGRGAYICREGGCVESAKKKNALKRSFKAFVPDEAYEELAKYGKPKD
ncbi:MAG: YlxR family protein [Clostridia bacterium]|nr:YlxR family protein [Clostridia bacterium]